MLTKFSSFLFFRGHKIKYCFINPPVCGRMLLYFISNEKDIKLLSAFGQLGGYRGRGTG